MSLGSTSGFILEGLARGQPHPGVVGEVQGPGRRGEVQLRPFVRIVGPLRPAQTHLRSPSIGSAADEHVDNIALFVVVDLKPRA